MSFEIRTINFSTFFGGVNCYLVKTEDGDFILIDTGLSNSRKALDRELENAGCIPGHLKLIVITHGDIDHVGNAAYLRNRFASKIAIHPLEASVVENGNMFGNRKNRTLITSILYPLFKLGKPNRFKPDVLLPEGTDLSTYGLDARVLHIPGHSIGSIGILTTNGDLFCGDMFTNSVRPVLNSLLDDLSAAKSSLAKLKSRDIKMIYPGHGQPFDMKSLQET